MLSDIDHLSHKFQQFEGPSGSLQQNTVNRSRRHLSRTITQPRGLYEAVVDTYGPINAPDVLQAEASEVDEAYRVLQASCSSDTETCSSHEDGHESHFDHINDLDNVNDQKDVSGSGEMRDGRSQRAKTRRSKNRKNDSQSESQKRSDQEWAKSILTRRTGYGCLQRNQVVKYISQLETNLRLLQTVVLNLSPQVVTLGQHRWVLQGENQYLKQKIEELSRNELFKEDQKSALEKEILLLRSQKAERVLHDSVPNSEARLQARGDSREGEAGVGLAGDEELSHEQRRLPDTQTAKDELKGLHREPSAPSKEHQANTSSLRRTPRSLKETQDDVKPTSTHLSLVKWPSSLYRSVSAIREDVLEVAIERSDALK